MVRFCQLVSSTCSQKRELSILIAILHNKNQNQKKIQSSSWENLIKEKRHQNGDCSVQRGSRHANSPPKKREACNPLCWAWIFVSHHHNLPLKNSNSSTGKQKPHQNLDPQQRKSRTILLWRRHVGGGWKWNGR